MLLNCDCGLPEWRRNGNRYYTLSPYFKKEFGGVVRKISVDAHFSCPNIDGTVGRGGCIFCDAVSFSPGRRFGLEEIDAQIDDGIRQLQRRFQTEKAYRTAIRRPEIVGLTIGTRPDALGDGVLDLLADIAKEKWLSLEIGLQTSHDATLRFLNRGHNYACFVDAVERAKLRNLRLGTHLILGLPGETRDDVVLTSRRVAALDLHSVKLHHLYVVKNTKLASLYAEGKVKLPTLEEYADLVVDALERFSPETVVERVAGEATEEFLVAPEWTAFKHAGRNAVDVAFRRRNSWQGKEYDPNWREKTPPIPLYK